ncbi:hypothetical protein H0H81_006809 [Sphagnurus paluster]|uniref:F-box domain-containing protein n=1 Tax=Sphagnurus paluster TaxID=117069 RepID=A0A9P7KJF2_9AGAR|nr:hypothetical protein H0H81_006809 [Sphagnurus paluster]
MLYRYGTLKNDAVVSIPCADETAPPINRLPVELLAEILFRTLEQPDFTRRSYRGIPSKLSFSPGKDADPMLLAQVCRHWRSVALSTPLLWSSIKIRYAYKTKNRIPLLQTWLDRSGTCPLSIIIRELPLGFEDPAEWYSQQRALKTEIMTLLISHSRRWKSVDFRFARRLPEALAALSPGSLPMLEFAAVQGRKENHDCLEEVVRDLDKFWDAAGTSLSLRKCKCDDQYCWHQYRHGRFRDMCWNQLTTIDVAMPPDFLFEILPSCRALTDLRYQECGELSDDLRYRPSLTTVRKLENPIILPYLRHLSMKTRFMTDFIFESITTPSLVSVSIDQSPVPSTTHPKPSTFSGFLARSNCRLQIYSYDSYIDLDDGGEDILLEILDSSSMSSLTDLTVYGSTDMVKLIPFLAWTRERAKRLPRLQKLALHSIEPPSGALSEMILSRRTSEGDGTIQLQELLLDFEISQVDLDTFDALRREGMVIFC